MFGEYKKLEKKILTLMAGQEVCVGMFNPSDVGVCVCVVDVILFTTRMGHS